MKLIRLLSLAMLAASLTACSAGGGGGGGGGGGTTPTVSVSLALAGPVNDPSGVAVDAVPSGFPGSGPYVVTWTPSDDYAGTDLDTRNDLPGVVDLSQLQTRAEGPGKSVSLTVTAWYTRGGVTASGFTSRKLCWVGSPGPAPC